MEVHDGDATRRFDTDSGEDRIKEAEDEEQ